MPCCSPDLSFGVPGFHAIIRSLAAVAQLDRVLGYEPRGRGFDSCQPHQQGSPESEKSQGFFLGAFRTLIWSGYAVGRSSSESLSQLGRRQEAFRHVRADIGGLAVSCRTTPGCIPHSAVLVALRVALTPVVDDSLGRNP